MPLYDYLCLKCGSISEFLIAGSGDQPRCLECGGQELKRMLSPHSTLSGAGKSTFPGAGDTACCGSTPANASCAGPGSCCGKRPS